MLKNNKLFLCLSGMLFLTSCIKGAAAEEGTGSIGVNYSINECCLWDLHNESCYLRALDTIDKSGNWESFKPFAKEIKETIEEELDQEVEELEITAFGDFMTCNPQGALSLPQLYLEKIMRKHHDSEEIDLLLKLTHKVGVDLIDKKLLEMMALAESYESGVPAYITQKATENALAKKELKKQLSGFSKEYFTDKDES